MESNNKHKVKKNVKYILIIMLLTIAIISIKPLIYNSEWENEQLQTKTSKDIITKEKDLLNIAYAEYRQSYPELAKNRELDLKKFNTKLLNIDKDRKYNIIKDGEDYEVYFLDNFIETEAKYIIRTDIHRIDIQKTHTLPDEKIIEENTIMKQEGDYTDTSLTFLNTKIPRRTIESIQFQNSFYDKPLNKKEVYDVSENRNGKVVCWVKDEDLNGLFELYVASEKGSIVLNQDSSLLLAYIGDNKNATDKKCIYGLDALDYRKVKKMNRTFYRTGYNTMYSIDFNPIDTRNVEEMIGTFEECGFKNLRSVSLYTLDLRKAKDVTNIFKGLGFEKMESLGLGHNSYINNGTKMKNMFKDTGKNNLGILEYNGTAKDFSIKFRNILNNKETRLYKENFSNLTHFIFFDNKLYPFNLDKINNEIYKEDDNK
ncbi:MAG: hypothetical protein ACTTGJ_03975 [Clostridium sp.]